MIGPSTDDSVTDQAEYWVVRLASGDIDAAELTAFKTWLGERPEHQAAFDRERALWQSLEGSRAAFTRETPAARRPARRWITTITPGRSLAAAAMAAALVVLTPGAALWLQADALAGVGEIRNVTLPDGSTAMLDSGAAIAVRFGPGERRIDLLRGQTWFDVRHGDPRPFHVAAMGGITQDVGTAFAVSRDDADSAVTVDVTQGAVRIAAPEGGDMLTLKTSERARYDQSGHLTRLASTTPGSIAPWRRGLIVIDDQSVGDAIAMVGRYRPGPTVTLADMSSQPKVSGVFRTAAPDEALITIAEMGGLQLTMLPGGIAILRR